MASHYAYLAECADGTYYAGYTTDVGQRERAHNSGHGAKYTKSRRPVTIIYYEEFSTKSEALKRERTIKRLKRSAKEALIAARDAAR